MERAEGEPVLGGSINGEAALEVTVERIGADTRLARMARLVEEAQTGEAPIQRLVDRISAAFVPLILAVAAIAFAAWWLILGDPAGGLRASVAVLVIACPCALGLATPTALVAGTGAAAKAGILIRDIDTLERARGIGVVAFDKTGTLTLGRPGVAAFVARAGDAGQILRLAAALEARSEHPLGKALVAHAQALGLALPGAANVRALYGRGITGDIEGRKVAVGNERLARGARCCRKARSPGSRVKSGPRERLPSCLSTASSPGRCVFPTRRGRRPRAPSPRSRRAAFTC